MVRLAFGLSHAFPKAVYVYTGNRVELDWKSKTLLVTALARKLRLPQEASSFQR